MFHDLKHRGLRLGGECARRFASRIFSSVAPTFHFLEHSPTELARATVTPFGLPTLDRFPRFSAMLQKRTSIGIQVMPKTAEIDQIWSFFLFPSSAVALLHYPQPSTKHTWALDLSPQAKHRDARPRVYDFGCLASYNPRVFNPRSRVSALSVVA